MNNANARLAFDNAKKLLQQTMNPSTGAPYQVENAKLTQSYLRSEVALSATQAAYHIPLLVNDTQNGAVRACENRLNLQDVFIPNEIAVLIGVGSATTSKPILYSYPNATIFTSATDTDLWSIYNGKLSLIVNNDQVLPSWDVLRHYKAPAIQELAALYYASSPTQLDELDLSTDGFYAVEPGFVLSGGNNNQMTLQAPGAPATVLANSFICVQIRGILCQNITSVK
jgi:hypothetical protein